LLALFDKMLFLPASRGVQFRPHARAFLESAAFRAFDAANAAWLRPYAAFCHCRDLYGTADSRHWGASDRARRSVGLCGEGARVWALYDG